MKVKAVLMLAGILLCTSMPIPASAEEPADGGIQEDILGEAPESGQDNEETMVQASYPWGYKEPVDTVAARSGRLDRRPLTKVEIANLYEEAIHDTTAFAYDIEPHIGAPYTAGRASQANRLSALKRLNMYRLIAGLSPAEESEELSDQAQHGAVLLAALNNGLSHYPPKPEDMDDDFYQIAYNAASSSNIGAGYRHMEDGIDGCISDNSGSNLTSVGHRRWFLNPELRYIGLGEARAVAGSGYGRYYAYKVFDRSGETLDHNFVSWPSSGNFPIDLISVKVPWSISLNRYRYAVPDIAEIVVEIRNPSGAVEVFSAADKGDDLSGSAKYFNVNTDGYGEGPCIICNFGDNYAQYTEPGTYKVKVTGLRSLLTGDPVTIEYQTEMFHSEGYKGRAPVTDGQYGQIEEFVERLYTKCLGRSSEEAGKLDWTMKLADRDRTGAEVGQGFVFSDEYYSMGTDDNTYLDMLYEVFLGRPADESGKAYWGDMLSNGVSRLYVFRGFAVSTEYDGICGTYGIERGNVTLTEGRDLNVGATMFVYRIYAKALGREAELDGLNDWSGRIARGEMSAENVAKSFFHSEEYQNENHSDEEYIKTLYRTFMGREYDDAGLADWLKALAEGRTRDEVMAGFSGSVEFHNIMAEYGL